MTREIYEVKFEILIGTSFFLSVVITSSNLITILLISFLDLSKWNLFWMNFPGTISDFYVK